MPWGDAVAGKGKRRRSAQRLRRTPSRCAGAIAVTTLCGIAASTPFLFCFSSFSSSFFSMHAPQIQQPRTSEPQLKANLDFFLMFFFASSVPRTQQLKFLSYCVEPEEKKEIIPSITLGEKRIPRRGHMPSAVGIV